MATLSYEKFIYDQGFNRQRKKQKGTNPGGLGPF